MSAIIKTFIFTSLLLFAYPSTINAFTLVPITPPLPTSFATVNGIVGLESETLTGGDVSILTAYDSRSMSLGASGEFSLPVAAESIYEVNATLGLQGLPNINVSAQGYPVLGENQSSALNLVVASGRVLAKVNVNGATVQNFFINASAEKVNSSGISEAYSFSGFATSDISSAEILGALPADVSATVSGRVQLNYANGCTRIINLDPVSIMLNDRANNPAIEPDLVEWNVDANDLSCTGSLVGEFRLDGLDASGATLLNHQINISGPQFANRNLTGFGNYTIEPLFEGVYSISQSSSFNSPYTNLQLGSDNDIAVDANTLYNAIHSVGTSHGSLLLSGDWSLNDISSLNVTAFGTKLGAAVPTMSANDLADISTGEFDFVMGVGEWNINNFTFRFDSVIGARTFGQSLSLGYQSENIVPALSILESQSLNIASLEIQSASAQVQLDVEQSGSELVTINQLSISGNAPLIDPSTGSVMGNSSINAFSFGTDESTFDIVLYGVPGTYSLNASGLGSDGRTYAVEFQITLTASADPGPGDGNGDGNGGGDDNGGGNDDGEALACYAINKVKLYRHKKETKDKLYIKYASFGFPDDAMIDLTQEDVLITIDGKEFEFPAGSFKQKGNKQDYAFKTASGVKPQIKATINLDKYKWGLKLNHIDSDFVDNSDGVDITLAIGNYQGTENVMLESKNK